MPEPPTEGAASVDRLIQTYGDSVTRGIFARQHWAVVPLDRFHEIAAFMRDDPDLAFDFLVDVTAVHWPGDGFEMVYHFFSYARNDRMRLKVRVPEGAKVPTLSRLWRSADWNERETYDMFGIEFEDHPDLRRILMPDDYTDFPLRKEFPLYRG